MKLIRHGLREADPSSKTPVPRSLLLNLSVLQSKQKSPMRISKFITARSTPDGSRANTERSLRQPTDNVERVLGMDGDNGREEASKGSVTCRRTTREPIKNTLLRALHVCG